MIDSFYRADLPLRAELSRISSLPLFAKLITRQDAANSPPPILHVKQTLSTLEFCSVNFVHLFLQLPRFEGYIRLMLIRYQQ